MTRVAIELAKRTWTSASEVSAKTTAKVKRSERQGREREEIHFINNIKCYQLPIFGLHFCQHTTQHIISML